MIVAIAFILIVSIIVIHINSHNKDDNYEKVQRQIPLQHDNKLIGKNVHHYDVIKDMMTIGENIQDVLNIKNNNHHTHISASINSNEEEESAMIEDSLRSLS